LGQGENASFLLNNYQIVLLIAANKENQHGLTDDIKVISKISEGSYPDVDEIEPHTAENHMKLDCQYVFECIQRVPIILNNQTNLVKLPFENNALEVSADSHESENACEKVATVYEGTPIIIAFIYVCVYHLLTILKEARNLLNFGMNQVSEYLQS
jgi:DNA polymerase-3 subunit beta